MPRQKSRKFSASGGSQDIGGIRLGMDYPPLFSPLLSTGRAICKQAQLLILDTVFHITPSAVLLVVELEAVVVTGADDELRVGAQFAIFQTRRHPRGCFQGRA